MKNWHRIWEWYHCWRANLAIANGQYYKGENRIGWVNFYESRKEYHIARAEFHYVKSNPGWIVR